MDLPPLRRPLATIALVVASLSLWGCSNKTGGGGISSSSAEDPSQDTLRFANETPGLPEPGQRMFASPQEAAAVLKDAYLTRDRRLLSAIFGPEGRQLIFTGDRVEENRDMESFGQHLSEYLRVDEPAPGKAVLHLGRENWPFPIPLVKRGDQWFFDTVAGKDELLNRRIGENELSAIAVCRAYVAAQKEYARKDRTGEHVTQYAQHFMSTPGKHDGLYWPAGPGEELSPMGPLIAEAHAEGYGQRPATATAATTRNSTGKPHPYHGYVFHILTAQGDAAPGGRMSYVVDGRLTKGFAFIASPSAWGASGIMTFIVNQDGKIYQKNLGPDTRDLAKAITEYNPDKSWEEVKD
jgi:hypothetical protein